jgi:hypothetical protein
MLTAETMLARGHLALDWAAGLVTEADGFRGAGDVINAYYKSVVAFTAGGRVKQARQIAAYLDERFLKDGDFNGRAGDPTAGGLANYRNGWLARGLHALGRYDMSAPVADLIEANQHPGHGGLATQAFQPEEAREYDWGSTGSAILSLLAMGRTGAAIRGGEFLIGMIEEQPATRGMLHLRRGADGQLMRTNIRQGLATSYGIDIGARGQIYWYLGIAMNAFANLLLATGEPRWREAGYRVFSCFENCDQEVYETISNGKVAWGLAGMFAATGDRMFARHALDCWAWHCRIQSPDGRWLRVGQIASLDEQPLHVTLDTTLERAFYMFELSRTLDV